MKTRTIVLFLFAVGVSFLAAQTPPSTATAPRAPNMIEKRIVIRGEMGKWWRDAEIAKKLQLSDGQITQLDQIFYDHRMKLIDFGADMEKQDLKLQSLLDADAPNEGEIGSQVDLVLAARGKLEREYTFMNLDLRKVLSLDQWKQLKSVRGERGLHDNFIYFQKKTGGPHSGPVILPFPGLEGGDAPPPPEPTL